MTTNRADDRRKRGQRRLGFSTPFLGYPLSNTAPVGVCLLSVHVRMRETRDKLCQHSRQGMSISFLQRSLNRFDHNDGTLIRI